MGRRGAVFLVFQLGMMGIIRGDGGGWGGIGRDGEENGNLAGNGDGGKTAIPLQCHRETRPEAKRYFIHLKQR